MWAIHAQRVGGVSWRSLLRPPREEQLSEAEQVENKIMTVQHGAVL